MTPVACANCGKLIASSDSRCFNCGALREPSAEPDLSPPSVPAPQSSGASFAGCVAGVALTIVLLILVGIILSILPASVQQSDPTVAIMVALGVVAVASIPVFFPYGRRLSVFVRWMLGTACVLLIVGLGSFAACLASFSNAHF